MGVATYSLQKSGAVKLSENFSVKEFKCNDGSDAVLVSAELVALLQKIRNHFGKPITINSAYRTKAYNTKVGGATGSQHLLGTACDITISGINPIDIAQYAETLQPTTGGIGLYKTFTHVDVRAKRTRWNSTSGKEVAVSGFSVSCPYTEPTTTVKQGSAGEGAKWVQWQLNRRGAGMTVDGVFGVKSAQALVLFQTLKGLKSDGICGAATRAALKK